jgi:hypothetical protein
MFTIFIRNLRMSLTGKVLSFAGLSSLAVSAAFAQSLPPSVAACTAEKDSLARLVCFDREVAKYTQSSARVAPTPARPSIATPSAPPVAAAPPVAPTPSTDDFGISGKLARERDEAKEAVAPTQKEMKAAVTKITTKPFGELVLELDNGQVWEQPEKKSTFIINVGEGVVIRKAKLGSYMLTADSGATTRIRRVR